MVYVLTVWSSRSYWISSIDTPLTTKVPLSLWGLIIAIIGSHSFSYLFIIYSIAYSLVAVSLIISIYSKCLSNSYYKAVFKVIWESFFSGLI
jgi:hypothetical protein